MEVFFLRDGLKGLTKLLSLGFLGTIKVEFGWLKGHDFLLGLNMLGGLWEFGFWKMGLVGLWVEEGA